MTRQQARARSRRRFERRRRQRVVKATLLLLLLVLIAAFGTNAVEILDTLEPAPSREIAAAHLEQQRPVAPQDTAVVPATIAAVVRDGLPPGPRVISPPSIEKIRVDSHYIPPGARISQRVKWELGRLKRLAEQQQTEGFVQLVSAEPGRIIAVPAHVRPGGTHVDYDPRQSDRLWTSDLLDFQLHLGDAATPFAGIGGSGGGASIPEPSTALLMGFGLIGLACHRAGRCRAAGSGAPAVARSRSTA